MTNDEKVSASDVATRASVDVQAKLSAIAEKALASAEGKAFQVGSTEVFVNPEAGEQGQANATQRGSGSRAQNSGANPASVPQGDTQVTAEGDESTLNLVADGDEASTVPIDRQQSSATSKPTDDAAARAQASAHGTSLQQQTSGGETSSEGDTSGERRGESPALKLVSAERGQASADAQAFTVEASGQNAERSETGQQSAGPRLSVTGESTDRVTQNERAVASAVSRGLSAAVQQRGGSLTLRLTPESLGAVRIDLDLSQGRVSANIHASTEAAQETLAKSIQSLRSSLESKGLAVDRLTVHLTPQTQSGQQTSGDANADDGARDQAQGDRDATGGQSRGRDGERGQGEQHRAFGERFDDAFGLDPKDPRAQTLRLRFSAVG